MKIVVCTQKINHNFLFSIYLMDLYDGSAGLMGKFGFGTGNFSKNEFLKREIEVFYCFLIAKIRFNALFLIDRLESDTIDSKILSW